MTLHLTLIALRGLILITPPPAPYQNRDMCEVARAGIVDDLTVSGALVLSARCELESVR